MKLDRFIILISTSAFGFCGFKNANLPLLHVQYVIIGHLGVTGEDEFFRIHLRFDATRRDATRVRVDEVSSTFVRDRQTWLW